MQLLIPPPVQAAIAGGLMWLLARSIPAFSVAFAGQRTLAVLVMCCGILFDLIAVTAFFRQRTTINPMAPKNTEHLVTSGLNQISRNPMYLGMVILLSGWAIWLGNPLNIAIVFGFMAAITRLQIEPEEEILMEKFGEQYLNYSKRVRRWL